MTSSTDGAPSDQPVERFKPTSGLFVGYAGLLFAAVILIYVVVTVHTVTGLQVALGAVFFSLVVWVTQLRSRAAAYSDELLLKNSLRDAVVPLALIEEVSVRQTLNVWAEGQRYVCIGIGSSLRSLVKPSKDRARGSSLLGTGRWHEFSEKAQMAAPDQTGMNYETFVVTRIEELAEKARKQAKLHGRSSSHPRYVLAWPEIVGLVVTGVAFLVSLFL